MAASAAPDYLTTDGESTTDGPVLPPMTHAIEISDDMKDRLDSHCEDGETPEELIEELVSMYETEGTFLQEGYSE